MPLKEWWDKGKVQNKDLKQQTEPAEKDKCEFCQGQIDDNGFCLKCGLGRSSKARIITDDLRKAGWKGIPDNKKRNAILHFRVPENIVKEIDALVDSGDYKSRSDLILVALREHLKEHKPNDSNKLKKRK